MNLKDYYQNTPALIITHDYFDTKNAKTAHGVILYSEIFDVVGIVDGKFAGSRACDVVPFIKKDIPIYSSVKEALNNVNAKVLILGVAPPGGKLPTDWLDEIKTAINAGLDIISGLHVFLSDIPEIAELAKAKGVKIIDLRKPPSDLNIGLQRVRKTDAKVVLCMGTDCVVGKRSAATLLWKLARQKGINAGFVATGQTGLMIGCDAGAVIDRIPSDFVAGQVEKMVLKVFNKGKNPIFVEGQGALLHPSYSGVTLSLLHGADPQAVILVHDPQRKYRAGFDTELPMPDWRDERELIEKLSRAKVVALCVWGKENKALIKDSDIPVFDLTNQNEAEKLLELLINYLEEK
ncbi:protein of unknown function DUF1611 [Methanocaldococcus sp. FS406-22]|uniref:DUF1611 domain-containing protein n=1 Tax=Methanocaldococcus sp. (strain FS406-22) TaxID=644281 RepID=UPI0001BF2FD1|nr:DUF1611 domain-containing protein [Methanocaldococcus sp. FS406-22]ADC70279.1 protein of unknown function DUF1611 [Methanocaldococcus sp. FS406-22]